MKSGPISHPSSLDSSCLCLVAQDSGKITPFPGQLANQSGWHSEPLASSIDELLLN